MLKAYDPNQPRDDHGRWTDMFHGSPREFNSFEGKHAFLTSDENVAEQYSRGGILGAGKVPTGAHKPTVYRVKVDPGNTFDLRNTDHRALYNTIRSQHNASVTDPDERLPKLESEGFIQRGSGLPGFGHATRILDLASSHGFSSMAVDEGSQGHSLLVREPAKRVKIVTPLLKIGSVIRDEYGQRFTCTSIRKYNHNHDAHGRFTFSDDVNIEGLPVEPIPKPGSKKDQVYQTYLKYGREAALEHGRALGMPHRAPAIMINRWQAQGIAPGTQKGFVLPPGLDVAKPPVVTSKPKVPGEVKPTGPLVASSSFSSPSDPIHLAEVQKGINAIPAGHQTRLSNSYLTVKAVDKIKSPRGMAYMGVHESMLFHHNSHGTIKVAKRYNAFGRSLKAKDVSGTTVHELGHGIDHINGWKYSPVLAHDVDKDARQMSAYEQAAAQYYFSNDKERFAELYKTAYTPGETAFNMPIAKARTVFAKSLSKMKELVG